jgi:hypothetical protein
LRNTPPFNINTRNESFPQRPRLRFRRHDGKQTRPLARVGPATMVMRA